MPASHYAEVLRAFKTHRVRFVVIGVSGINFYADEAGHMFSTQDFDILLQPLAANLLKALRILAAAGYQLEANREPLVGIDGWLASRIIERKAVIRATKRPVLKIDIVIDAGGISYVEWEKNSRFFAVEGVRVPIGSLPQLIRAKEAASREKDRQFLALYKIQLKEMLREAGAAKRRPRL